jgi:hypothetical protein
MATLPLWTQPLLACFPGATEPQVEEKLRHALKEFYLQSRAWRRTLGPFDVTDGAPLVTLNPVDANTQVVWVRNAWFQEGDIRTPLGVSVCKITEAREGKPTHFYSETPYSLTLWPTPDTTIPGILFVEVALTTTAAATVIPEVSETHHFEAILDGAFARMYAMPNKPWTDPLAADRYSRTFRRRCLELRAVSDASYLHVDPPWRFPRFA